MNRILSEMKRHHLGIPAHAATLLTPNLTSEENKQLLAELEDMHGDAARLAHWTDERKDAFIEERKSLHRPQRRANFVPIVGQSFVDAEHMPKTTVEMERLFDIIQRRGGISTLLTSRLMQSLLEEGRRDDCVALIEKTADKNYEPPFQAWEIH